MAAQIPIKNDPSANMTAMNKVKADKLHEVKALGHDGTWVAHPDLAHIAMDIFNEYILTTNQLHIRREDITVSGKDLLNTSLPNGKITEKGIKENIEVSLLYCEAWLRGIGCSPINNLMEDAATAEICRTQVWQWLHNKSKLSDGRMITQELYEDLRDDEIEKIQHVVGSKTYQEGKFTQAICLFNKLVVQDKWEDFLTLPAYDLILSNDEKKICEDDVTGNEKTDSSIYVTIEREMAG